MRRLEWRMLEVGHCLHLECAAVRGGRLRVREFPSLVGLLRHPSIGWILFDTGYSQRFFDATARFPEALYRWLIPVRFEPQKSLARQLSEIGVAASEIAAIVVSHFHADHVAGVVDFPDVPVYCSRAGWDALCARGRLSGLRIGFLPELAPATLAPRLRFFEDAPIADAPDLATGLRMHALFGGSLLAVSLPGHAPGHYGLLFRADDDRFVMLVGDASWSTLSIRENRPAPAWTTGWLGDTRQYRDTLTSLHALSLSAPDFRLVPSHCPEWRP